MLFIQSLLYIYSGLMATFPCVDLLRAYALDELLTQIFSSFLAQALIVLGEGGVLISAALNRDWNVIGDC